MKLKLPEIISGLATLGIVIVVSIHLYHLCIFLNQKNQNIANVCSLYLHTKQN